MTATSVAATRTTVIDVRPAFPRSSLISSRGFTLIELAITVAIVGVLATAAYPFAELTLQRQKESELRAALREIRTALDAYHAAVVAGKVYRSADDSSRYPKQLEDLVNGIENQQDPKRAKIYFLRRLPRDPFADTATPAAQTWGKRSYASPPDFPMEGVDVFDVYSLSERKGMNGIAYREW